MKLYICFLLIIAIHNVICRRRPLKSERVKLIEQTVIRLQNLTRYFDYHYQEFNVDALFGIRAAEGGLYNLITHHTKKFRNDIQLLSDVRFIYSAMRNIAFKSVDAIRKSNSEYFQTFQHLIDKRWYYQSELTEVDYSIVQTNVYKEDLSKALSDMCMSNLMGTQKIDAQKICHIPDDCWSTMVKKGTEGYYLTHQGLFFILADYTGCSNIINSRFSHRKLKDHLIYLGSNIYAQLEETFKKKNILPEVLDLFIEQMLVCKWLGMQGCFTKKRHYFMLTLIDHKRPCITEPGLEEQQEIVDNHLVRKLPAKEVLSDSCSAHTNGLYIAYLSLSIHWLLTEYESQYSILRDFASKFQYLLYFTFIILLVIGIKLKCGNKKWRSYRFG